MSGGEGSGLSKERRCASRPFNQFLKACAGLKKGRCRVENPAPFIPAPARFFEQRQGWRVALPQSPLPFRRMNAM